jgi:hypothetical protein
MDTPNPMQEYKSSPPGGARVRFADADCLIATWNNVVICVWRKGTTGVGVAALHSAYDAHAKEHPEGVFLMTIVERHAETPSQAIRAALARFLEKGAGRTTLSAVVQEGTGFRAAFVRSIVTGLALMAKLPYPHKVFGSVTEATMWFRIVAPVAQPWDDEQFIEAVREVRERKQDSKYPLRRTS